MANEQETQAAEEVQAEVAPTPDTTPEPLGDGGIRALQAEREARKVAEKAAKDAADRLAELERLQLSEQERAVTDAREEGRAAAAQEWAGRAAEAELRASLTGKVADVDAILAFTDASRFVRDGQVDTAAIAEAAERLSKAAPKQPDAPAQYPPVDLGPRNGSTVKQLGRADMVHMTPAQIEEARAAGQFNDLLGIKT